MFAYIPARGGSKRLPGKNIRELDGTPVIGHVLRNLAGLSFISNVHVSTDDRQIRDIAESYGAVCLEPRLQTLAGEKPGFAELISDDLPRYVDYNGGDEEVLFVLATAALVPPRIFCEAYTMYVERSPEILMSCEPYQEPIWWALAKSEEDFWSPLYPDKVTVNSQDLPITITDSGLFYFFNCATMKKYNCHKNAKRLLPYFVPFEYRIDINTQDDWDLLEWKYARLKK